MQQRKPDVAALLAGYAQRAARKPATLLGGASSLLGG